MEGPLQLPILSRDQWKFIQQSLTYFDSIRELSKIYQKRDGLIGSDMQHLVKLLHLLSRPKERGHFLPPTFIMSTDECNNVASGKFKLLSPESNVHLKSGKDTELDDATGRFRIALVRGIWKRLNPCKPQFSSMPWMCAIALDPYFKKYIFQDSLIFEDDRGDEPPPSGFEKLFSRSQVEAVKAHLAEMEALAKISFEQPIVETFHSEREDDDGEISERVRQTKRQKSCKDSYVSMRQDSDFALPPLRATIQRLTEVERWGREPPTHTNPREFWKEQYGMKGKTSYKFLAIVAQGLLGVPRSSAECERDFSILSVLLSYLRQKMSKSTVMRKIFLALNKEFWDPNPEFADAFKANKWTEKDLNTFLAATPDSDSEDSEDSDSSVDP